MATTDPYIQRISFEEIQEFYELNLFDLTWESTGERLVLLAYDPVSRKFVYYYGEPGGDGGDRSITMYYKPADLISSLIDDANLSARPSINGFANGDGILVSSTVGTITKLNFYEVSIDTDNSIDTYVFVRSFDVSDGQDGQDGADGANGVDGQDGADGATGPQGPAGADGATGPQGPAGLNADNTLQKFITYPTNFSGQSYTITSADKGYSIVIINGDQDVNIIVPAGLVAGMQVGFIRDGVGEVTIVPSSVAIRNAISGTKIDKQYDQALLEQGQTAAIYYLLGNIKV